MADGTGGAGVASAPSILGKDRGSPCSFKISCNTITCTLSMLESSYTGRGRINKQTDCKPTAHPIFDYILIQHNKELDPYKNGKLNKS